ncbi:MAG TPA: peptidylprolyl isomerase [Bryobacteraceae bacterium]|nr:peptidylprolyl isomerase [Bryobacteraceae bacterium]
MRQGFVLAFTAAALLLASGCSSSNQNQTETKSTAPAPAEQAPAAKNEQAPELFRVNLDTTKGPVVIEIHRDWAPIGVDHFYNLVKTGFYDGDRFFRIVRNFVVQFGINGDPKTNSLWANSNLPDDPVKESNVAGTLTYATAGPNTRSTQMFINLRNNASLDQQGFAPIGKVVSGMAAVESLYSAYGDMPPQGEGPDPSAIEAQGNEYLDAHFPRLDYIKKATVQ